MTVALGITSHQSHPSTEPGERAVYTTAYKMHPFRSPKIGIGQLSHFQGLPSILTLLASQLITHVGFEPKRVHLTPVSQVRYGISALSDYPVILCNPQATRSSELLKWTPPPRKWCDQMVRGKDLRVLPPLSRKSYESSR